jgi:hypothetical protein
MWKISQKYTCHCGFQNNFLDHRRLSEQILDLQAAIGKPEQASLKRVTGRTFTVRK